MTDDVLVERRGSVLVITINRPDAKNALNGAVAQGIADAVDLLESDDELKAGVLTGAGGTFSAGMDLKPTSVARRRWLATEGVPDEEWGQRIVAACRAESPNG